MTNPFCDPYLVLSKVYGGGAYLKQALADTPMEELSRARTVKICYGVLENDGYFNDCIRAFAPKNPKLPVRILLKISLYLLLFMDKPRYMITDNAVKLCKKLGKGGTAGFLNAFLRAFDAEKVPVPADKIAALAQKYSYPEYAVRRLVKEYGDEVEKILAYRENKACVRFACTEEEENVWARGGEKTPFDRVYRFSSFRRGEGYDEGKYTFQSIGSIAICDVVEPSERFLDACAAPGGKSVLLAAKCREVTAFELHPHRVKLIEQYAARMGVNNVTAVCRDSSVFDPAYENAFGGVLCDVPCSGFGVVCDNPDIKLFRTEKSLTELPETQFAILSACSRYVKGGGALYYSTCSVFREENDNVVGRFLKENPAFSAEKIDSPLAGKATRFGVQFLPHISSGAGFYVAKLRKR